MKKTQIKLQRLLVQLKREALAALQRVNTVEGLKEWRRRYITGGKSHGT